MSLNRLSGGTIRLTVCLALFLISLAPGNAAQQPERFRTEAMEEYQDPPVYIYRLGESAAMITELNGFVSHQVNVDANGNNIVGDAANEPSLCVDLTNHNRMAVGWRQFDSAGSNFREAGYGFSNNGGTTWSLPGVLENNVFRSDPVLAADDGGRLFYLSLLGNFFDDMWRSVTGGFSWARIGSATGGDKQWFTIDTTTTSSGRGYQYQSWSTAGNNYNGRQFSRSTNGGSTWMNPVDIPNSPVWGTLDVDSNGDLFLGGMNFDTNQIWCLRSSNAKFALAVPSFDRATVVNLGGTIDSGRIINPEGLVGQLYVVADRSGSSTNNNIYLLASVLPAGATTGSDVMIVRSSDGGQTFSAPVRVNDDPINPNKWHWLATLSVAPNGRLDAVWLDTRNAANDTDSQLFYSYSVDGGSTWAANIAVSAPFNPLIGYPNQAKMGDYIGSVSDNGGVDVAYCATFNGEQDIYHVRITPPGALLLNISSRAPVLTGDQVVIAGFIINGSEPKRVIVRGLGPSLTGVGGALSDPTLELHQGAATLALNDDWKIRSDGSSQQAEVEATLLSPSNDLESAILATLNPGEYTAILAGKNGATGGGLVEVYDLARETNSKLANISTRGFVGTGDNVLIGGFIVDTRGGGGRVIIRAIGPSLGALGVQGALQDPTLALHDANGALSATNDNWKIDEHSGHSQEAEVRATTLPPTNDLECAIIATLPPGPHTAIVRGKNNTTGVALVEVYSLP